MADLYDSSTGTLMEAIKADLSALDLEAIGDNWHIRKAPWLKAGQDGQNEPTPIGIIWNMQERRQREGLIGLNDWRIRTGVALILSGEQDLEADLGLTLLWREKFLNRYANSTVLRAYDVPGLMGSDIEPGTPQDLAAFMKAYDAQFFVINSRIRLPPTPLP